MGIHYKDHFGQVAAAGAGSESFMLNAQQAEAMAGLLERN